jgi:hypothetical protein
MVSAGAVGVFALAQGRCSAQVPAMLPRHLVPLALGLAAFAVAEAASDITHESSRPHAVACVAARIAVQSGPRHDAACRYDSFETRDSAEQFARERLGGVGAPCGCD